MLFDIQAEFGSLVFQFVDDKDSLRHAAV